MVYMLLNRLYHQSGNCVPHTLILLPSSIALLDHLHEGSAKHHTLVQPLHSMESGCRTVQVASDVSRIIVHTVERPKQTLKDNETWEFLVVR